MEKLLELVEKWRIEELEYSKRLRELAEKIRHPVLRAIFLAISKDSEKHHHLLTAIRDYIKDERPLITEEDVDLIRATINKHVKEEKDSIIELSQLKEQVKDPAILLLIEAMLEDEKRHHKLLYEIERIIAQKEKISDQELWEALWLHSPYHGTPGG